MKQIEQKFYRFLKRHRALKRWKRLPHRSIELTSPYDYIRATIKWSREYAKFWDRLDKEWNHIVEENSKSPELLSTTQVDSTGEVKTSQVYIFPETEEKPEKTNEIELISSKKAQIWQYRGQFISVNIDSDLEGSAYRVALNSDLVKTSENGFCHTLGEATKRASLCLSRMKDLIDSSIIK